MPEDEESDSDISDEEVRTWVGAYALVQFAYSLLKFERCERIQEQWQLRCLYCESREPMWCSKWSPISFVHETWNLLWKKFETYHWWMQYSLFMEISVLCAWILYFSEGFIFAVAEMVDRRRLLCRSINCFGFCQNGR
jgi:hypothetical protein